MRGEGIYSKFITLSYSASLFYTYSEFTIKVLLSHTIQLQLI